MADSLFVPMLFYILTQWDKLASWPARFLWFGLFILIKNELLSVRDSYHCYNIKLYLLDFSSLLIFLFAVQALTKPIAPYGYDPHFWYFLSSLWFLYAVWDIVMFNQESDMVYKRQLKVWAIYMAVASAMTAVCALLLGQIDNDLNSCTNKVIFLSAQIIPGTFILYAVGCWLATIRTKFISKSEETSIQ